MSENFNENELSEGNHLDIFTKPVETQKTSGLNFMVEKMETDNFYLPELFTEITQDIKIIIPKFCHGFKIRHGPEGDGIEIITVILILNM